MKITHEINQSIVKSQVSKIQSAIKEHLKIDAGKQAGYHIFAVSHFLNNDQELKALLKKDSYTLTANLGTKENPCVIKHELGYFENENFAKYEAEQFIRNCQKQIEWNLLKNGELLTVGGDYVYTINSKPTPKHGIQIELTINAEKYSDAVDMLEYVVSDMEEEYSEKAFGNDENNYHYFVFGDEFDYIENAKIKESEYEYVLFDSKEIKLETNEEYEAASTFAEAHERFDTWKEILIYAESIEVDDALEIESNTDFEDDVIFHAFTKERGILSSGNISEILEELKYEKTPYCIYREISRHY